MTHLLGLNYKVVDVIKPPFYSVSSQSIVTYYVNPSVFNLLSSVDENSINLFFRFFT